MVTKKLITGRIIPAYAGSTRRRRVEEKAEADHPRIRGEHRSILETRSRYCGSSPHTRGARPRRGGGFLAIRIIPAYAGSTTSSRARAVGRGDHPRIRGEHF